MAAAYMNYLNDPYGQRDAYATEVMASEIRRENS
jgi:hypothetical protein